MPVKKGLDSDKEEDLAKHISDFYESKGLTPEEVIDKVSESNAPHIPDAIREAVQEGFALRGRAEVPPIEEIEEPKVREEYHEEEWKYPGMSQSISVPRDKSGRFSKGKRVVSKIVRVVLPPESQYQEKAEVREEYYEQPDLGEEYKNESWSYPEDLGGQVVEISVPRDAKGKWLKGKRVIRSVSTPAEIVDKEAYESYQEYGATQ